MLHAFPSRLPSVPYRCRAPNCQLSMRRFGRVAFACPGEQLQQLESDVRVAGHTVHTPYVSLDTPGKATVQVVILQDPDGHEVRGAGDTLQSDRLGRGGDEYSAVGLPCRSASVAVRPWREEGRRAWLWRLAAVVCALALACERVLVPVSLTNRHGRPVAAGLRAR